MIVTIRVKRALHVGGVALAMSLGGLLVSCMRTPAGQPADPPLVSGYGTRTHTITTSVPLAQEYFNQGLRLLFGFNQDEALAAFQAAARHDSTAAMAWWGIAMAQAPNVNVPMDSAAEHRALAAVRRAQQLAAAATKEEQAYIAALATRFGEPAGRDRAARDSSYTRAMRDLAASYPEDADAQVLFVESLMLHHPWAWYAPDGTPSPGIEEAIVVLERTLAETPDHPGACHFLIHAVEMSVNPGRATACAEGLAALAPKAGHLVHMPAHTWMRIGRYGDAVAANVAASAVDSSYFCGRPLGATYPTYYAHNLHFLAAAAAIDGQSALAIATARGIPDKVTADAVGAAPALEYFLPTADYILVMYRRWQDILALPPVHRTALFSQGIRHYARALAHAHLGDTVASRQAEQALAESVRSIPADRPVNINLAKPVLRLAQMDLEARLARLRGDLPQAIAGWRRAIALEDSLRYDEPPIWYLPVRRSLAHALLNAGDLAGAEQYFRDDLARMPRNAWSLDGLARTLQRAGRRAEAAVMRDSAQLAWARADGPMAP
jgi:tetratricopeptide (TPR) repeat protein